MLLFPAIDLYEGKAVRLYKGRYDQMTVYSEHPEEIAMKFAQCGAKQMHIVDLQGAKDGTTTNLETIKKIRKSVDLFMELGGGIRSLETIDSYIEIGIDRVILGTAAVNDRELLKKAVEKHGDKIAVGVDIKDGYVAIKGWTEKSEYSCFDFCEQMQAMGIKTLICTDISKDGAMNGTNHELYSLLSSRFSVDIIASGGVSSIEDIKRLSERGLYGAIIGKAYYTGAIDLEAAIKEAGK